ncbi:MAG: hypothetical protein KAS78_03960 [Candidatus Pacebacteria bacterium]|nr:hypothetical protein [Candidatus Paceibacterota bacterium]
MKKILDYINIIKKKSILLPFVIWLVLCLITILVFYKDLYYLMWIDIPTHFMAGIVIGAVLFTASKKNVKKTVIISFSIFIAWEFFEIIAASISEIEFLINIFSESMSDQIQDVVVDALGLAFFFLIYKKYYSKRKAACLVEK